MAKKFADLKKKMKPDSLARAQAIAAKLEAEMPLHELRRAYELTQTELAKRMSMDQPAISRLEKQQDMLVSTLARYVEASGGKLEVKATFPEGEVRIENFSGLKDGDEQEPYVFDGKTHDIEQVYHHIPDDILKAYGCLVVALADLEETIWDVVDDLKQCLPDEKSLQRIHQTSSLRKQTEAIRNCLPQLEKLPRWPKGRSVDTGKAADILDRCNALALERNDYVRSAVYTFGSGERIERWSHKTLGTELNARAVLDLAWQVWSMVGEVHEIGRRFREPLDTPLAKLVGE